MGRSTSANCHAPPWPLAHTGSRSNGCRKYAPELNDIEVVWHDLKAYQLAHKTFTDVVELNDAIHTAVSDLNRERMTVPLANPRDSSARSTSSELATRLDRVQQTESHLPQLPRKRIRAEVRHSRESGSNAS